MSETFTVATRDGGLALAQTKIVTDALKAKHPNIQIEIKKISTKGDRDKRTVLWKLRTTGFFTSHVEESLLSGRARIAVHSFKDLPTQKRGGLSIAAVFDRVFAEDCLIAAKPITSIDELAESATVGTSSLRRIVQLKRLRSDLKPVGIRGNVASRIKSVDEGKFDAVILARAGVERIGMSNRISFCFKPKQFIPAPAQGALAVQTRDDDTAASQIVAQIDDKKNRIAALAERQILVTMKCGCHAPVGAFAEINNEQIEIDAFISDLEGKNFINRQITGPAEQALELAEKLADVLLCSGGREILETLEK